MVTDFILTHVLNRAWREACLLLSDEERLDLSHYPQEFIEF